MTAFIKLVLITFVLWGCLYPVMSYAGTEENDGLSIDSISTLLIEDLMDLQLDTAGKRPQKVRDIPASTVIVTRKDIERYGYSSLEDILKNVPGMYGIDDFGPYQKTFGVRGFWTGYPRNIVFLVNGVSQADGLFNYHVLANFNLPVEAIDRIEIVRGPMSVMYGSGAFFGAINIITNEDSGQKPVSLASVSYGSHGAKKIAGRLSDHTGDGKFSINVGTSKADGPDVPLADMTSNPSGLAAFGISEYNNTTKDRLESETDYFNFSGTHKGFYTNISFNQSTNEMYFIMPSYSHGTDYQRKITKLSGGYKTKLSDKVTMDGKLSYHNFSFVTNWDIMSPNDSGGTTGKSETLEAELKSFIAFDDNLHTTFDMYYKLVSGCQYTAAVHDINGYFKNDLTDDIETYAFFTQVDYSPMTNLKLIAGLRLEQLQSYSAKLILKPGQTDESTLNGKYPKDDIEIIPRLAAIYSITPRNIVKLLYGKAIAQPSYFQLNDQILSGRDALETEYIETYELNYIAIPVPNFTISGSLFHNVFDNLIVRNSQVIDGSWSSYFANTGEMTTNGVELTAQVKLFDRFQGEISGTFQETKDKTRSGNTTDASYSPDMLAYLKASYNFDYGITCALTGIYVDELKPLWDESKENDDGSFGAYLGDEVNGYFTVDANMRIDHLFKTGFYLNIKVMNLLNKEYRYPTYVNNKSWMDKGSIGQERSVLATIGYKF